MSDPFCQSFVYSRLFGTVLAILGLTLIKAAADGIYWTDPSEGAIYRADLDGTNVTDLVTGAFTPWSIA